MNENLSLAMVVMNEGHRLEAIVRRCRPYVREVVIGVQDSTDDTLAKALDLADRVARDEVRGFGDATFGPKVLPLVRTPWTLKIDGDELPTVALMASLGEAIAKAGLEHQDAIWIPFKSWIEDEEWAVPHGHVRVFQTRLGWPATMHSSPETQRVMRWDVGFIEHRKTLDEHVRGYLGYLERSGSHKGWIEHNTAMIYHAVTGTAKTKGWDWIKAHDWWPSVEGIIGEAADPEWPEP